MRFSDRKEEEIGINMTPLIDVVFLLLIFFMVSTTFSKESQLRIRLPESSDEPTQQEARIVEIEISAEGVYAVKGPDEPASRQLLNKSRETLRRALKNAAAGKTDLVTVIRADRLTPHEYVIQAMDISRRLGLVNITFATQQAAPDSDTQ